MSKKYANTQTFEISQSPLLNKALVGLHIIAIFAAFVTSLRLTYIALVVTLVIISLFYYSKQSLSYKDITIRHSVEFGWEVANSNNNFFPIEILPSTILTHYLIVLHYKTQTNKKKTILICKDALINDKYRKLMVDLKVMGLKKDVL